MKSNSEKTGKESQENIPHCPDCEECLQVLQIVLDEEASEEQKIFVLNHIEICSHCFECYEVDKTLREAIKQKIAKLQVPTDLIECIKNKIGELTT